MVITDIYLLLFNHHLFYRNPDADLNTAVFSDDQETVKTAPKKKRTISDPTHRKMGPAQPVTSRPRHSSSNIPTPRMSTGAPAPATGGHQGVLPGGEDNCHISQFLCHRNVFYNNKLTLLWGEAQLCLPYVCLKKVETKNLVKVLSPICDL